jgi:hypothetical protein
VPAFLGNGGSFSEHEFLRHPQHASNSAAVCCVHAFNAQDMNMLVISLLCVCLDNLLVWLKSLFGRLLAIQIRKPMAYIWQYYRTPTLERRGEHISAFQNGSICTLYSQWEVSCCRIYSSLVPASERRSEKHNRPNVV